MSSYERTLNISEFKGLLQYGDGINSDMRYAVRAENAETIGGVLQPAAACQLLIRDFNTLENPIETIAYFYRRWHTGPDKEVFVAASGGRLYFWNRESDEWEGITEPSDIISPIGAEFESNVWSWVTYEINVENTNSTDVLLLSNAYDGMVMVYEEEGTMVCERVATPKKFGTITRHAERIWGGGIIDDPDMLMYSAPYDPTNWEQNEEIPEDGAGDLLQPSWDGDSFTTLKSFGSQLIAFKRTRIWRVLGTNPGEYTFKEQFGGGAPYPNTVAVDGERIFMLSEKGVHIYDGLSSSAFQQEYCAEIWKRAHKALLKEARAVVWQGKYYIAIALDLSSWNNAVVIYDPHDGTWLLRTDVCVENWLVTEDALYFTSTDRPVNEDPEYAIWQWKENSWDTYQPTTSKVVWETPWTDMGAKNVKKGGFDLYFLCEALGETTLNFTVKTEKRERTKTYKIKPGNSKQKRIHYPGNGRRYKLIIEGSGGPWRLMSGIQMIAEIDAD